MASTASGPRFSTSGSRSQEAASSFSSAVALTGREASLCGVATVLSQLEHPIVQAPMGGGPSTPALAAAVSEAGGLGFLAAGYRAADAVRAEVAELRALTSRRF